MNQNARLRARMRRRMPTLLLVRADRADEREHEALYARVWNEAVAEGSASGVSTCGSRVSVSFAFGEVDVMELPPRRRVRHYTNMHRI